MDPTLDILCPGCFATKGQANPCPHCGYDDQAERSPLLLPHRTLLNGQFVVGRVLGKPGGFGITYLGWDLNLETRVAIKEYLPRDLAGRAGDHASIAPHSREDGELFRYGLEQFLREARTLAQLDHPNIVRVRQFFEANGTAYLVMDYYQGLSLGEHLERQGGRLPEDQAKQLMLPILDGLRAVHAKGFLHRDIKPQNIYLARMDSGGVRPILLDFGAARQAMGERSRSLSVVVSAGYAPFEQYQRRGNQGPWTDVYAAAAVLYLLVTGEAPPEAIERISGDEIKPAASFGVSKQLSDALGEALTLAPEARPQTVPEFQVRLWGSGPPPEPDPAPTSPIPSTAPTPEHRSAQSAPPTSPEARKGSASPAEPGATSRRWLWSAVLAVVVALLGLGGWYRYYQDQIEAQLRKAADDRAYEVALGTNTEAAYRAYLSACAPDGCDHRSQAEQRLRDLAAEAQAQVERVARERAAQERAQQEAERQAAERQAAADARPEEVQEPHQPLTTRPDPKAALKVLFGLSAQGNRVRVSKQKLAEIWFSQSFQNDSEEYFVVFVNVFTLNNKGQPQDCHGCAPSIGAVTYKLVEGNWTVVAKQLDIISMGEWGRPPQGEKAEITELAKGHIAFLFENSFMGQGVTEISTVILGYSQSKWHYLGNPVTAGDNGGSCDDSPTGRQDPLMGRCYSFTGELSVGQKRNKEYPNIIVKKSGTYFDYDKKQIIPAGNVTYVFNGKTYVESKGVNRQKNSGK